MSSDKQAIVSNSAQEKWKVVAGDFNAPFIKNYCTALGYAGHMQEHGFCKLLGCVGRNFDLDYIALMSTWDSAHEILKKRVTDDPQYLEAILETIEQFGKEFTIWTEENFLEADLKKLLSNDITSLLDQFIQKQSYLYTKGTVFSILDYGAYRFVEDNLRALFAKSLKESEREEAMEIFTTPTAHSFQQEQEMELKALLDTYRENTLFDVSLREGEESLLRNFPDFWHGLSVHTKKYAWLFYSYMGPAYTEHDFLMMARTLHPLEQDSADIIVQKRKELISKIKPNNFERMILDIAEKMVWAKPRRKDYQSKAYYHLSFLFREIADRLNLSLEEIFSCTYEMLANGLNGKAILKDDIASVRRLHVIIPTIEGSVKIILNAEAEDFREHSIAREEKVEYSAELKGTIAYKGIARGVVRIINKPSEMEKMQKGDILVSMVTTPDIVPAMKKAAAFITDKGGLTCHAAIVARELKVPCIVGTEIATNVLQDGDMVEVDATIGVVTKIHV